MGEYNILAANTLMPFHVGMENGLYFSGPKRWRHEWTQALVKQNRFQRITIQGLATLGARYFCWVRPHEVILSAKVQPDVPHGGFAYLFHDDLECTDERDRFFQCLGDNDTLPDPVPANQFPSLCCGFGSSNSQPFIPFKLSETTDTTQSSEKYS